MINITIGERSLDRAAHSHRERGSNVVEMAIVVPLLFLLTLGAFELGRGVWAKHVLSHVAREATRYACVRSVRSDDPATVASVAARAKSEAVGIDPDALEVETSWNPTNDRNATVRVTVRYLFRPATRLLPFSTIQLTSSSSQVVVF